MPLQDKVVLVAPTAAVAEHVTPTGLGVVEKPLLQPVTGAPVYIRQAHVRRAEVWESQSSEDGSVTNIATGTFSISPIYLYEHEIT